MSDVSLFVRKASGLVRAWSVFDAFIYATFSINLITLGLFIFSYCYYLQGSLITGVVIGAVFTVFEVIVYASLISAMPRAGGDYVWQSRILNRAIGFILAVTGWWFILWLWTPLYGQMLTYEVYTPLLAIAGLEDAALWFLTPTGQFIGMLSVCLIVFIYIAIGMKWYARIQKFCFWGGMIGLAIVFLLLLFGNNTDFIASFNEMAPKFGAEGGDVYAAKLGAQYLTLIGDVRKFSAIQRNVPPNLQLVIFMNNNRYKVDIRESRFSQNEIFFIPGNFTE